MVHPIRVHHLAISSVKRSRPATPKSNSDRFGRPVAKNLRQGGPLSKCLILHDSFNSGGLID
jgi:hypothetical protein